MIKEHYTPEPRKPRLIWNGREKRKVAEPLPSPAAVSPPESSTPTLRKLSSTRSGRFY